MTELTSTEQQARAVNKLRRLKVGALFMEMGTGKTKVALDLMADRQKKVKMNVWICPCSLKATIEEERQKWHPELSLTVVGVESIGASDRIFLNLLNAMAPHNNRVFLVVDESLKIKNIRAKRTKRLLELSKYAQYKLILNGTPLSKNILDLYSQMRFLSDKILPESWYTFRDRYCEYWKTGVRAGRIKRTCNVANLVSRISPYIYDASLNLGVGQSHWSHGYSLTREEQDAYEAIKEEILMDCCEDSDINFYRLVTACLHFLYSCESKKMAVQECIEQAEGKCVVFVRFLHSIPAGALRITGEMSTEERAEVIDSFRAGKEKALWITFGCGAFGLNLQFCHNLIFADRTWDYSQMEQAEARVYRLGQEEHVDYHTVYCSSVGIEDMISRNLDRKTGLLDEVKEKVSKMNSKEKAKWLKKHL